MTNDTVLYEKKDSIGFITINRPEVKNALNRTVLSGLVEILDRIAADDDVRSVVLSGAGDTFVAGADINELLSLRQINGWAMFRYAQSVSVKLEDLGKPSIAAIRGLALGGGLELALSCTFRIASPSARLGLPELGLGIIPASGGTERLVRCVGHARAADMLLSCSIITGEEAYRVGLVNRIAEEDQVLDKAREWATELGMLSPVAVRLQLELLMHGQAGGIDQGLAMEAALGSLTISSDEARQLLAGFVGKGKAKKE